jgi:hypothetical protein
VIYLPLALEIANDRTREAERLALAWLAGQVDDFGQPTKPRRPSRARALIARPVRAFSNASHAVSEVACSAATRIEGSAG